MAKPAFDPSQPLDPVAAPEKPAFDPAQPFEPARPTLDATGTGLVHFARHLALGLGDKIIAAEQAGSDILRDKSGTKGLANLGDLYRRNLGQLDTVMDASDEAHPTARWVGNAAGFLGSSAALAAPGLVRGGAGAAQALSLGQKALQGAKLGAVVGGAGGYGGSRSDSTRGALLDTGLGSLFGAGAGAAAPYAGELLGRSASWLGGKAEDAAGWLKVHSLHPTPTLGERMADLPGGEAGVGRDLLARGIGGLTKKGTAEQIDRASEVATKVAGKLANAYDSGGGAPVDISNAIFGGAKYAQELQAEPTTRAAGDKLSGLLDEYAAKYRDGLTTAADALKLKRALGKVAYGSKVALGHGDTLAGDFGDGVAQIQRGVDDALDGALGPDFAKANLAVRRLMGAGQAADRGAARTQGNAHLLGALPALLGAGGFATGHGAEGAGAALGMALLQKYGAQVGARALYSPAAGTLSGLGRLLQAAPGAFTSGIAAREASPFAAGLLRPSSAPLPAMASEDRLGQQQAIAAMLRQESP